MLFRVRIDEVDTTSPDALTEWAVRNTKDYVVMHHVVNFNKHFHLYMDAPMIMSPQSLRYKVRTYFKLENTQYSVGVCDEERIAEYLSYLYNTKHGNVATLIATSLPNDTINTARDSANAVSVAYELERAKKPKAKSLYEIAKEVNDACEYVRADIVKESIRLLHKYCKCHDSYLVRKVVETVLSMKDPESYEKYILTMIA